MSLSPVPTTGSSKQTTTGSPKQTTLADGSRRQAERDSENAARAAAAVVVVVVMAVAGDGGVSIDPSMSCDS